MCGVGKFDSERPALQHVAVGLHSALDVLMFAFFINPIGASAINPGTQNLGPIHPHHPSSRGASTLTSVASSTGPALPNWILPETPVAGAGLWVVVTLVVSPYFHRKTKLILGVFPSGKDNGQSTLVRKQWAPCAVQPP